MPVVGIGDEPFKTSPAFKYHFAVKRSYGAVFVDMHILYHSPVIAVIKIKHIHYFVRTSETASAPEILKVPALRD